MNSDHAMVDAAFLNHERTNFGIALETAGGGDFQPADRDYVADAKSPDAWVDREVADCEFKDERLGKRFQSLLAQLSSSPGDSIPLVCQDWANTKAAYRFLDNDRVSEAEILGGHFQATRDRAATVDGPSW